MSITVATAGLSILLTTVNLTTLSLAAMRLSRHERLPVPRAIPPVSVVIPARGVERFSDETLTSAFSLDYPDYELIFCVAQDSDPIIQVIERHMAAVPHIPARILTGDDRISENPKLNNCVKGWDAARNDWVVLADSNVLMPADYIQQLFASWEPDTGLVCSTPIGSRPDGFWAEVECAFLNTLQARWQYAGESVGQGYAQGKSMLWNKPFLDGNGGIRALAAEIAEDAAATKLVRRAGRHVHLANSPFEQPLGSRTAKEIWSRQIRWARLRRVTFPALYVPEIFIGSGVAILSAMIAATNAGVSVPAAAAAVMLVNYVPEMALAARKGWHTSPLQPVAMLARDFMIPAVWMRGWLAGEILWHGQSMDIRPKSQDELDNPSLA
ncbi:glycosyltransferase [Flaviflagellibacter deserti]|uniref:Glycosyltransferase n=1 Tax=Flaviflagellibacter deserti TaxID=2267266 RepID=A0ABV9YWD3_9HYPH